MISYNNIPDDELITHIKTGDQYAFAEMFERYSDLLYAHAYNKLRNKEEARDIVQDVFVKFWNRHTVLDIRSNLSGYLYTMVRNGIFSLISHKQVINTYATSFNQFQQQGESITDHLVRKNQLARIIETEIAALPPRMREVFELSRKENLSHKQIAQRLGISELTVADQIKKALKQLKMRIGLILIIAHYLLP